MEDTRTEEQIVECKKLSEGFDDLIDVAKAKRRKNILISSIVVGGMLAILPVLKNSGIDASKFSNIVSNVQILNGSIIGVTVHNVFKINNLIKTLKWGNSEILPSATDKEIQDAKEFLEEGVKYINAQKEMEKFMEKKNR